MLRVRGNADGKFGDDAALRDNALRQLAVAQGVHNVEAVADHCEGIAPGFERGFVAVGINANRKAAGDGEAVSGKMGGEGTGIFLAALGWVAAADHANLRVVEQFSIAEGK